MAPIEKELFMSGQGDAQVMLAKDKCWVDEAIDNCLTLLFHKEKYVCIFDCLKEMCYSFSEVKGWLKRQDAHMSS